MPANLPPQYFEAEKVYRQARSPAEKIEALETMLAIMPKHKGTDHLKAELRARIARLTQDAQRQAGGAARAQLYEVQKEGAGQAVLVGLPNVGKSALLAALTDATPKVADYPFTTQLPQPAMVPIDNVQVQLVDLPPVVPDATPPWQRALVRQADLVLLVVDLSGDPLTEWATLAEELPRMRVAPIPPNARSDDAGEGMPPAGEAIPKKALLVATRYDTPGAEDALELLVLDVEDRLPILAISSTTGAGLEELKRCLLDALDVVRVYAKPPGKPPDREKPFVLKRGSTIEDLADAIHHDLRRKLRYGVLWGASSKFSGQRVGRQHRLEDEDVVELYA
jgi:ribosome-interacting GTPase 1